MARNEMLISKKTIVNKEDRWQLANYFKSF